MAPAKATPVAETARVFGERLQRVRLTYVDENGRSGLSQHDFAKKVGLAGERPGETLGLYERGQREPKLWLLAEIRRLTGVSLDALIAGLPPGHELPTAGDSRAGAVTIAERLIAVQRELRLTDDAIMAKTGATRAEWSSWTKGTGEPRLDALVKLAGAGRVSTDWLLSGAEAALSSEHALRLKLWIDGIDPDRAGASPVLRRGAEAASDSGPDRARDHRRSGPAEVAAEKRDQPRSRHHATPSKQS